MDLDKTKAKYYFCRLLTDYENLKNSNETDQDTHIMNLLYTYHDACFSLGRPTVEEFMQAIILSSELKIEE